MTLRVPNLYTEPDTTYEENTLLGTIEFTDQDDPTSLFGMHTVSSSDDRFYFEFDHYEREATTVRHFWRVYVKAGTELDHELEPTIIFDYHLDAHPDVAPEDRHETVTGQLTVEVEDHNEAPRAIQPINPAFSPGANTLAFYALKASEASSPFRIITVLAYDPDAIDDVDNDPDNRFGETEITLGKFTSQGFTLVSNESSGLPELFLEIDEARQAYTNRLSVMFVVTDNPGAPEDERLTRGATVYIDIQHDLELLTPDRWSLREDTPLVFGQAYDNALTISGADGALLDVVIQVDHGSLSTDGQQIGDHATNSTENTTTNKHTLTFTGIDEHDLSALLEGLVYTPGANYYGSDELELSVSDGTTTVKNPP